MGADYEDDDTSIEDPEMYAWRCGRFEELGFSTVQALQLAQWEVDTHEAVTLVNQGCPHSTAVRILRPLPRCATE